MNWKTIFKSFKSRDMQKRVIIVLFLIIVYRLLAHVPVPLAEPKELHSVLQSLINSSDLGGFINLLSGGALVNLSVVLIGLSPFITASVITQMLTKVIPKLEELNKEGESGRRRIQQWTRIITLPLSAVQAVFIIYILRQTVLSGNSGIDITAHTTLAQWALMIVAISAATILLMWIGELVTEQGIGNGMSMLIAVGIMANMPKSFGTIIASLTDVSKSSDKLHIFNWVTIPVNTQALLIVSILTVFSAIVLYAMVKINEAQRVVPINYAKRVQGNRAYGGVTSILPIKLITGGVVPVIFAVAFLMIPAFVGQLLRLSSNNTWHQLGVNLTTWFQIPSSSTFQTGGLVTLIYPATYFLLIVGFTYFYTSIAFDSNEIAENLQKQGGFISNIRPGQQTAKYLTQVLNRLNLFGSLALGIIAVLPYLTEYLLAKFGIQAQNLAIGGTGLLIVITVSLETIRHINSRALMVTYDQEY